MFFTSYSFLFFLTILIMVYYLLPYLRAGRFQWIFLLFASYLFYGFWDVRYLLFLVLITVSVWCGAGRLYKRRMDFRALFSVQKLQMDKPERTREKQRQKKKEKHILFFILLLNIGILAAVKSVNRFVPLGISFYTFQAISYLIDVYREKYPPEKNLAKFALYVSFFPQLIQGPISRFDDLSKTLYSVHRADKKQIIFGLQRILWGFFKKLVIADRIVTAVQSLIQNPESYGGIWVFIGMLFYALELYADFTGGIDITIGIAEALGIKVRENFRRPYFSKSVQEYWQRWHISMGTWFRDYVFYPLSISAPILRLGKWCRARFGMAFGKRVPVYLSAFCVWTATGVWHGFGWNFVAWGMGNFVILMISQELEPFYMRCRRRLGKYQNSIFVRFFRICRTIFLMSCLRMFDCYRDVGLTFRMFGRMFTQWTNSLQNFGGAQLLRLGLDVADYVILVASAMLLLVVSLLQRRGSVREQICNYALSVQFLIWYGMALLVLLFGVYGIGFDAKQFIYNQF